MLSLRCHSVYLKHVDLGVAVNSNLEFSSHINSMFTVLCSKVNKQVNVILRYFESRNLLLLISAFKVYVRPILQSISQSFRTHVF